MVSFEFKAFQGNQEIQDLMESPVFDMFFGALGTGSMNFITPEGFLSVLSIYIYLPLSIYSGLLGAGLISKEEKNKTAEYLFTLPVSRKKVLTSKLISGLLYTVISNISVILSAYLIFGRFETSSRFNEFLLNLSFGVFLTQLIFFSVGVGLASILKDYKKSGSMTIAVMLSTFMIAVLSNLVDEANFLRFFTPFRYFEVTAMLEGNFYPIYFILTGVIVFIGIGSLYLFYPKRDLYI